MKRIFWLGIGGVVALGLVSGARPRPGAVVPAGFPLSITQTERDFGELRWDQPADFEAEVKNITLHPVMLKPLETGCGCTTAKASVSRLAPGESGKIRVTFDPTGYDGNVVQKVSVRIEDNNAPPLLLTLRAHVTPSLQISTRTLDFRTLASGAVESQTLHLKNHLPRPLSLGAIASNNYVLLSAPHLILPPNGESDLKITLQSPPFGALRETVTLTTDAPGQKTVLLPVQAEITSHFAPVKPNLFVGFIAIGESVERQLEVKGLLSSQITQIVTDFPEAQVALTPTLSGSLLTLRAKPTHAPPSQSNSSVFVTTKNGDTLRLAIVGSVISPQSRDCCKMPH